MRVKNNEIIYNSGEGGEKLVWRFLRSKEYKKLRKALKKTLFFMCCDGSHPRVGSRANQCSVNPRNCLGAPLQDVVLVHPEVGADVREET